MSRDALFMLFARVVSAGSTVLLLMYIGQTQGGPILGIVGTGLALGVFLSAVTDAGTSSLLIREGARNRDQIGMLLVPMCLWRVFALAVAALGLWGAAGLIEIEHEAVLLLLALGLPIQQFAELPRAAFIARQEIHISSLHSGIENVCWLLAIVGLLAIGVSLETAFAAGLAVFAISVLVGFLVLARRGVRFPGWPDAAIVKRLIPETMPFAIFVVIGVAYTRLDTLLVAVLIPTSALTAAGAYYAAARLLAAIEYFPEAIARAAYPRIAKAFRSGDGQVAAELSPLVGLLASVGIPVPVLIAVAGPWLMTTMFGTDVAPFAWLVIPLGVVVPLRFLSHLFGMALTSTDRQLHRARSAGVALILVAAIDIITLPTIGIVGAVIGSITASAWICAVYAAPLIRRLGDLGLWEATARSLIAAIPLGGIAIVAKSAVGPAVAVLLFVVAYFAVLLLARRNFHSESISAPNRHVG